ncbi:hypothetical protein GUITHDRAFT_105713 [Guillardia theta CCMP2712]|uniref:Uncharacterized protein n=1 Tax=Guillardia theta (strain CCMP2712) TaxID=905079 RepID=L1JJ66_GUITC|nr:hypothetical protein GUITHDRAFT_105713 [Guillardia theta CCMP2712]EKX48568.1 hypothetical protein GUITHDRAFT_105713 [Guillardia theta CCMP2712]|eukprot:XP_005835548.1 hypothetical protein GUITHDRAFT_105713 [Guillardia theta CCMP2712]
MSFSVFLLGTGTLVAWNSLLAAVDYFRLSFPGSPSAAVWFTWLFEVATLVTLLLISQEGAKFSFSFRFGVGFLLVSTMLLCIPAAIDRLSEGMAWTLVFVLAGILAMGSGVIEAGQGFAGLLVCPCLDIPCVKPGQVCGFRILTKATFSESDTGVAFFAISSMIALICAAVNYTKSSGTHLTVPPDRALRWGEKLAIMKQVGVYAWSQVDQRLFVYVMTVTLLDRHQRYNDGGLPRNGNKRRRIYTRIDKRLLGMSYLRVVFIPSFMVFGGDAIRSDLMLFFTTAALGYSNGALSVVCMTYAPQACLSFNPDIGSVREREHAGYIMVVALLLGVSLGATVAIPLNFIVSEIKGQ